MSHSPTVNIETLKSSIPLESIIGAVVELKHGKGRCPFHNDRNPSFSIKGSRFRCFACGESGDIIDFTEKYYGLSTCEAIRYLADRAGFKSGRPEPARIAEAQERKELLAAFRAWERELSSLLAEALRLYRKKESVGFTWREAVALADVINDFPYIEYCYDILCGKDDAEKFELFKQEHGI